MLWFYRRFLVLFLAFALVLAMIRLVGSTLPSPLGMLFTNPDGSPCRRPCVFGILPHRTTLRDAVTLLKLHPLTKDFRAASGLSGAATRVTVSQGLSDIGLASAPDGTIGSIMVLFSPALHPQEGDSAFRQVTLGDIILQYGIPDMAIRSGDTFFLFFTNDDMLFRLNLGTNDSVDVTPSTPLRSLIEFEQSDCSLPLVPRRVSPWLGFVNTAQYSRAATTPILFAKPSWPEMKGIGVVGCPP